MRAFGERRTIIGIGGALIFFITPVLLFSAENAESAPLKKVPVLTADNFIGEYRDVLPVEHSPRVRVPVREKTPMQADDLFVNYKLAEPREKTVADERKTTVSKRQAPPDYLTPPVSNPPFVSLPENLTVNTGEVVTLVAAAIDIDHGQLFYRWQQVSGESLPLRIDQNGKRATLAAVKEGVYILELTVNNGELNSAPATCAITVVADDF